MLQTFRIIKEQSFKSLLSFAKKFWGPNVTWLIKDSCTGVTDWFRIMISGKAFNSRSNKITSKPLKSIEISENEEIILIRKIWSHLYSPSYNLCILLAWIIIYISISSIFIYSILESLNCLAYMREPLKSITSKIEHTIGFQLIQQASKQAPKMGEEGSWIRVSIWWWSNCFS